MSIPNTFNPLSHLASDCHQVEHQGAKSLEVHTGKGKICILPWAHFIAAEHHEEPASETLQITFSSAEVVIQGTRLLPIQKAVAEGRLVSVNVSPPERRTAAPNLRPLIERIAVHGSNTPQQQEHY